MGVPVGRVWRFVRRVFSEWNRHDAPHMSAALAFYTILSLSPLLLIVMTIAGIFVGRAETLRALTAQIHGLIGPAGDRALSSVLAGANKNSEEGWIASALSFVVVLFSASGIFVELRTALDRIWAVETKKASGIWGVLRDRVLSFGMVLSAGFLFVASLVASAAFTSFSTFMGNLLGVPSALALAVDLFISLVGLTVVFALLFRYVTSADVSWRAALEGAVLTALLFTAGKYLLALYIGRKAVGSEFGAAGSVVVAIVWIYYTAQIVFFGAESTHILQSGSTVERIEGEALPCGRGSERSLVPWTCR